MEMRERDWMAEVLEERYEEMRQVALQIAAILDVTELPPHDVLYILKIFRAAAHEKLRKGMSANDN